MRELARSKAARRDIRVRQHLVEGSFAEAVRYGFKRARWRRLWREQIQEYLTAAIQNMMKLLRYVKERGVPCAIRLSGAAPGVVQELANRFGELLEGFAGQRSSLLACPTTERTRGAPLALYD
jgi:ABC-type Zn uptake system ZnuABC Zn-binding protein ZnuA